LDILQRKIPDADFTRFIDTSLGKADPNRSVPWRVDPPPVWASQFRPRVIWDLGCALGAFTEAVIIRLLNWGCLERLERLVLVEGDISLHPNGVEGLKIELSQRMDSVFRRCGLDVVVDVLVTKITFHRLKGGVSPIFPLDQLSPQKADLVIASHLTYYFEDGSGDGFIRALRTHHLKSSGKIWCVVRNLDCPIYRMRKQVLEELNMPDPKPHDYAEHFQARVIPSFKDVLLQEEKKQGYSIKGVECLKLCHALMWRELPGPNDTPYKYAARAVCCESDPLFKETHFILEGRE